MTISELRDILDNFEGNEDFSEILISHEGALLRVKNTEEVDFNEIESLVLNV